MATLGLYTISTPHPVSHPALLSPVRLGVDGGVCLPLGHPAGPPGHGDPVRSGGRLAGHGRVTPGQTGLPLEGAGAGRQGDLCDLSGVR